MEKMQKWLNEIQKKCFYQLSPFLLQALSDGYIHILGEKVLVARAWSALQAAGGRGAFCWVS